VLCPRAVPPQTGGPLLFVSDLPSWGESREQRFGVGDAGFALKRILGLAGIDESETSITSIRCSREPHPGDCDRRLPLPGSPRVIVALGDSATRILTSFPRHEKATMTELHGHVIPSTLIPGALVVPCFPPENLGKGSANLTGVVVGDLRRARALSRAIASRPGLALPSAETGDPWYTNCPDLLPQLGMQPEPELICDPPLAWFDAWVESLLAAISERGGKAVWLAVDIETLHSGKSLDAAAVAGDPSYTILRINFASHPDEGITVPFTGAYESAIRRVLASSCTKVLWNWRFDIRRLQHAGFEIGGRILDAKDWWHALQSDMGGGDDEKEVGAKSGAGSVKGNSLGFVAPLLAPGPAPWKHLGEGETAAAYAAKDAAMTLRIAFALEDRLRAESMLSVARIHLSAFDQYAIGPAEEVGLGVDR
jgi:uracil-DNA glycosylase